VTTPLEQARKDLTLYAASTRTVTADGLAPLIAALEIAVEDAERAKACAADAPCVPEGECPPGGWSTGCEVHNAGGYQLAALKAARAADACPLHSPTGSPCDCGHGPAADCHPNPRRNR
jgi:hypothetical protein